MNIKQAKDIIFRHSMLFSSMPDDVLEALQLLVEQEPCEDEYIKVPKKALKYRTSGMVAYNAEWLKNHFDIERVVICGLQESCDDVISRQVVKDKYRERLVNSLKDDERGIDLSKYAEEPYKAFCEFMDSIPLVNSQETKTDVLDKIKAEIEIQYRDCAICEFFEDFDFAENDISEYRAIGDITDILQIIDKYRESEPQKSVDKENNNE